MAFEGLGTIHNTPHPWLVMHNNVGRSFLFSISNVKTHTLLQNIIVNIGTIQKRDLIEQIRNYNDSFPNGYPRLLDIIIEKFYSMLKQPY